jgi:uncharacterized tellurite resistance protein B-like protein
MLHSLKDFFDRYITADRDESGEISEHALQLAAAALLIEISRMDNTIKEVERREISHLLREKFALTHKESTTLMALAEEEAKEAVDYYQFTSLLNKGFTAAEKVKLIECLWRVAYADRHLDKHQEYLVRKVTDLLYVSHRDFIAAKHRVQPASD